MNKFLPVFLVFLISLTICNKKTDKIFLDVYMKENKLTGTVIIENLNKGEKFIYNEKRSKEPYLPASTFKIINTLIALQEGVIKDEYEIIKWDGKDKGFAAWNKDQNIISAFPESCVWFYQELARRIGNKRYLYYLNLLKYGNGKTGNKIETFWLDGDLRISAEEQIEIIKNIYLEKYQFNKKYYDILKKVMIVDKSDKYTVRAKTGWTMRVNNQIGWYVGYVEVKNEVWFFACNLDIKKSDDADFRKKIIYRAFEELDILK